MWHRVHGPKPLPQEDAVELEPMFRTAREQRARKTQSADCGSLRGRK
jgi:hypothetical protein